MTHKTNQDIHHKGLESYQVFVSEIEKLISDKKEVLNQTISKLENEIGEKIHTIVHNEINSLVVEDIKKKGTIAILDEFNHALKEIDQSERNTIIVAIKALLNKNVLQGSFIDDRLEDKKLPSDTIFHKHYNRLKTCILSGVAPMIVGPAGSGKSLACEQIAKEMGLHFYVANRVQNSFELTGFVNAQGKYVTTQFYEVYPPKSIAYKISDSMGIRILDMPNHYLNVSIDHKKTKRYQLQFHDEEESQYYGETEIIKLDSSVKSIGKEEKKDTSDKLLVNPNLKRRMFSPFELISREVRNIYLYLPKTITMLLKKIESSIKGSLENVSIMKIQIPIIY